MELVTLSELLKYETKEKIEKIEKEILSKFKSLNNSDVEKFLKKNAIEFEKKSISTTYLVFNENNLILGYFSLANRSLILSNERFSKLSKSKQSKLLQSGQKLENDIYIINSYLIGQLGKNFSISKKEQIKGIELLSLAFKMLLEAKKIINTGYVWLECENQPKLLNFYSEFGFTELDNYVTPENNKVMIIKLK